MEGAALSAPIMGHDSACPSSKQNGPGFLRGRSDLDVRYFISRQVLEKLRRPSCVGRALFSVRRPPAGRLLRPVAQFVGPDALLHCQIGLSAPVRFAANVVRELARLIRLQV